jgi:hypothetical protein
MKLDAGVLSVVLATLAPLVALTVKMKNVI